MDEFKNFLDAATLVLIVLLIFTLWVFDIWNVGIEFINFIWTRVS